ncbi:MAG: hypothetical protein HXX10_19370 [Rhodoplanes sp.]|uniref:hypothetical protein n=1 Tax=Rhodoplanes sp. TaxID=1968906 RepID=UPI0017CEEC1E|nr:hypothetical protein [Rhodoplanes sp.]NVO16199.1 hypothetical protein [Rhodoplanes sp.]
MADPVTIGVLAASALGLAGETFIKGYVGEAAKEAYKALKEKIAAWANDDVQALEKAPTSGPRQQLIAEVVDQLAETDKSDVRALAEKLIKALRDSDPTGLVISKLDALDAILGNVTVTAGTGVNIGEVKVGRTFKIGDITVGPDTGKK